MFFPDISLGENVESVYAVYLFRLMQAMRRVKRSVSCTVLEQRSSERDCKRQYQKTWAWRWKDWICPFSTFKRTESEHMGTPKGVGGKRPIYAFVFLSDEASARCMEVPVQYVGTWNQQHLSLSWTEEFEILVALAVKSSVFWDITSCSLVKVVNRCFGGKYRPSLQGQRVSQAVNQHEAHRTTFTLFYCRGFGNLRTNFFLFLKWRSGLKLI